MWFIQWNVWPALILTSRWKSVCLSPNQVSWTLSPKKRVNLLKRWSSSPNSPNLHLWRIPWSQPHTFGPVPQCCTCHPPRASSEEKNFLWKLNSLIYPRQCLRNICQLSVSSSYLEPKNTLFWFEHPVSSTLSQTLCKKMFRLAKSLVRPFCHRGEISE